MTSAMAAAPLRLSASLWLLLLCAAGSASAQSPSTAPSPPTAAPYMYPTPGFDDLSAWNRVAMIATILVFFVLSVLSGRELWRLVYGSRMGTSTNAAASGGAGAASGAAAQQQKGLSSFITPRQGATPSAPLHSTGSAVGVSASAGLLADESAHAMSTGAEMRLRFFVLLFLASTIRVVALVVEITTLRVMEASPARSLYARLLSMFLWLPALLFVSMYGLVLLFWAQLCYACWGKAYPWPRRVFFAFNVMLYVLFLVLLAVNATSGGFWRACDIMLGAVYLIGLIGILYYSVRLIQFFRLHGPDDDFFFDLATTAGTPPPASPRQIVLRRISAVCALLSVLFVVKASYLIGLGLGFVPSEETAQYRSPVGVHHLVFEFSMHFFTEFVPCSLLLFFTRKSTRTRLTPTAAQTSVTPGSSTLTLPPGGGGLPLHFGLRGRNNSAHSAYQDDTHSVGSGSLTGYQFQTMQRTYGATLTTALRTGSTPATYQSVDNATTTAPSTAASTSYV